MKRHARNSSMVTLNDAVPLEDAPEVPEQIDEAEENVSENLAENADVAKFIESCQNGDLTMIQHLLDTKRVHVNDTLADNVTGLHWASINNRLSVCKLLLREADVDINKMGGDVNATPLHWACRYGLVYIVDLLLKNGADYTLCDSQGFNCLHLAVHSSNLMLVVYLLTMTKIDIGALDPSKRSALHWAAYQGDTGIVHALVSFGARVNEYDSQGFTPLHWSLIRATPGCLKVLIKNSPDISLRTSDGKSLQDIAFDMDHVAELQKALRDCGKDGVKYRIPVLVRNPKLAKLITFFVPYVVVGLSMEFLSKKYHAWEMLLFNALLWTAAHYTLQKLVFPSYVYGSNRYFKSPLLSGTFSSIAFWVIVNWAFRVLPNTLDHFFVANVTFLCSAVGVVYCFFKSMFLNPGVITGLRDLQSLRDDNFNKEFEPQDTEIVFGAPGAIFDEEKHRIQILKDIQLLIEMGKFDSKNFCTKTFIRKPLRSKYSSFSGGLVARFDHFCPWVNNDIGLRNHKLFLLFVIFLEIAILVFTYLALDDFDYISSFNAQFVYSKDGQLKTIKRPPHSPFQVYEPLPPNTCVFLFNSFCNGLKDSLPLFCLTVICLVQSFWIFILLVVQLFQIARNFTSYEVHEFKNPETFHYSPVPNEMLRVLDSTSLLGLPSSNIDAVNEKDEPAGEKDIVHSENFFQRMLSCEIMPRYVSVALNLFGINQFIELFKKDSKILPSHFNFGMKLNCLEFWCLGNTSRSKLNVKNVFRIAAAANGQTYIGDQLINYYQLYDYPIKKLSYNEIV